MSDSTSYQIKTNAPAAQIQSIVTAIRSNPIQHYRHPGLMSVGACCYTDGPDGPAVIEVHFPLPRPTIPELIAKWHAEPTQANREVLWRALDGLKTIHAINPVYLKDGQTYEAVYGKLGDRFWQIKVS